MITPFALLAMGFTEHHGSYYLPDWHTPSPDELDSITAHLLHRVQWLTKRTARHECFMSTEPRTYSYGNRGTGDETYTSVPFTLEVAMIKQCLNKDLGTKFNVCFLNKYDDEHQHLGWHADDFPGMDPEEPIVSMSFGAEREIWVKDKRGFLCPVCYGKESVEHPSAGGGYVPMPCNGCESVGWVKSPRHGKQPLDQRIKLEEGSVFLMPPGYQDTHLHRIPKHDRPCGPRVSLTFRTFK